MISNPTPQSSDLLLRRLGLDRWASGRAKLAQRTVDALRIWHAGVEAVAPANCLPSAVQVAGDALLLGDTEVDLSRIDRIAVVGAGKGGAGMVGALEEVLGGEVLAAKHVHGWVNVPADCVTDTRSIHLHPARPAGVNAPTAAGAQGTEEMLRIVAALGPRDLCIVVITGGGSALLPAPIEGVTVDDKIAVAEELAAAGANIEQLNTVRRALSRVKGGGLARACRAGRMVVLLVSDVPGDPLDAIASGPTVPSTTTAADALDVLRALQVADHPRLARVSQVLADGAAKPSQSPSPTCAIDHVMLANNAVAVDAAGIEAERLGYNHAMTSATAPEGPAEEIGRHLADMARHMRDHDGPNCLITGGEPTVRLPPLDRRGKGGRNQQLVLAALEQLGDCRDIAIVSGGTDGEDGPTNAAGAFVDAAIATAAHDSGLDPRTFLERCDAYRFFAPLDALIKTGPTNTNVCDLRVVVVGE